MGNHLIIPGGTRAIDATGKYILPGGIDLNVHLQRPGYGTQTIDDFYQGTKAALAGGTTMVVDMVVPDKEETLSEAFERCRKWADDKVCCDYALKVAVTAPHPGLEEELSSLTTAEVGVNMFSVMMAGPASLTDSQLIETLGSVSRVGGLLSVHSVENEVVVTEGERRMLAAGVTGPEGLAQAHPEEAETEAVMRASVLAGQVGCPALLTGLTSTASLNILAGRASRGAVLAGEITTAGLVCDGAQYFDQSWVRAASLVCSPPVREGEAAGLIAGLSEARGLQVLSSQHAAYNSQQRALGRDNFQLIPRGLTGVEERLVVAWEKCVRSGQMSRQKFVEVTSAGPAKLLNIFPQKGSISVGADADVIIWDPKLSKTLSREEQLSKCDVNIYQDLVCTGGPEFVIFKGRMVLDQGTFRPMTGFGEFQPLPPFSPHLYDRLRENRSQARARPVLRTEEDLVSNGFDKDAVPPPVREEEVKPANQQVSSLELDNHPDGEDTSSVLSSPSRSSVRVKMPPGGVSSGFW